jgi:hypothetical protein
MSKYHDTLIGEDIHVLHALSFANESLREGASGLTAADVGKVARQEDDGSFWILRDEVGPVWDPINNTTTTAGQLFKDIELRDYCEAVEYPTSVSGSLVLNLEAANVFSATLTEDTEITILNAPPSGKGGFFTLIAVEDATGDWTITWPSSITIGSGAVPFTAGANSTIIYTAMTIDGGTTWYLLSGWRDIT